MRKWLKVVVIVWFLIFLTDIITAFILHRPIFCIGGNGGECSVYGGLGYIITIYYHWDGWVSYPQINPWGYILINVAILTIYFIAKRIRTKKNLTKELSEN
jgi:hypothetical protein